MKIHYVPIDILRHKIGIGALIYFA